MQFCVPTQVLTINTSSFVQASCFFYHFTCNSCSCVMIIVVGHICSANLFDLLVLLIAVTVNDVDRVSLGCTARGLVNGTLQLKDANI